MVLYQSISRVTSAVIIVFFLFIVPEHVVEANQYGGQCTSIDQSLCSSSQYFCFRNGSCAACPSSDYTLMTNVNNFTYCLPRLAYGSGNCSINYYTSCKEKDPSCIPLGDYNPCIDSDTSCIQNDQGYLTCLCADKFYRRDDSCRSVDELAVSKVSATSTTNKVTLTWIADNHGKSVRYSVQAIPRVGQLLGPVTDTGATWGNLNSGAKYIFNITTTLAADYDYREKNVSVLKQNVWTVPAKPGHVTSVSLISGSPEQGFQYAISFQSSPGNVARYSVVINNEKVDSTQNSSLKFNTLYPGQTCNFTITAYNEIDNPSEPSTGSFKLNTSDPGLVRNLTVTQDNLDALQLNLTFLCPHPRSLQGNVLGYRIQKLLLSSTGQQVNSSTGQQKSNTSIPFVASKTSCSNSFNAAQVGGVLVERSFNFTVRMWNDDFVGSYSPQVTYYVAPRAPRLKKTYGSTNLLEKVDNEEDKSTEFTVRVCSQCLLDSSQGTVTAAALGVCVTGGNNSCSDTVQLNKTATWGTAMASDFNVPYLTTPANWLVDLKAHPSSLTYTIGHDISCASIPANVTCNGPLPANRHVTIIVIQCNSVACGQVTYENIFYTNVEKTGTSNLVLPLALGLGLGCLVLVAVIVIVVFCLRRKKEASPYNEPDFDYKFAYIYGLPSGNSASPRKNETTNPYIDPVAGNPNLVYPDKSTKTGGSADDYLDVGEAIYEYIDQSTGDNSESQTEKNNS